MGSSQDVKLAILDNGQDAKKALAAEGTARLATGVSIAYQLYCFGAKATDGQKEFIPAVREPASTKRNIEGASTRVIFIMGFAAGGDAWLPLVHTLIKMNESPLDVLVYDNRGVGSSSVPHRKSAYTTNLMAADALGLMDHVGWSGKAHVVGFSMGGMIACKLAATAPDRVASLTLLGVTGGGTQIIPLSWSALKIAATGLVDKSVHGRAYVDVKFHFSHSLRRSMVNGRKLGHMLVEEYVQYTKLNGRQSPEGEAGHFNACWTHSVSDADVVAIQRGGFPVRLIHGRHDLIAKSTHAARLAGRLCAPLVLVDGGHFIVRENANEVAHVFLSTLVGKPPHLTGTAVLESEKQPASCFGP